ncbi:AAA family ATPase, partial [Myxococcota bacterium]|nr:AAA family ATPase [Myxococcota bacterium]
GAGKSRVLSVVQRLLSNGVFVQATMDGVYNALKQHEFQVRNNEKSPFQEKKIEQWRSIIAQRDAFTIDGEFEANLVLDFFPKQHSLDDHRRLNELEQKRSTEAIKKLGTYKLEHHTLAYLASVLRRGFTATHHNLQVADDSKSEAIAERDRLEKLIEELLGVVPTLDLDQQPTLFGRPAPEANLSHGQSLLLQIGIALHAQGPRLDGLVLLLDEPECHLHPSAVIEVLQKLRSFNRLGQIWIATHSVPILASVPAESIWYVHEGGVSWAGRRTEVVLEGLLGGPSGRERMEEFLRLPAQFASNRFAAECLIAPGTVMTGSEDPQARQLREFCETELVLEERSLRILDFGAGQGRLLSAMHECWAGDGEFSTKIDYRAFEPNSVDSDQLVQVIDNVYSNDGTRRLFGKRDELAMLDDASADVVVMCNVLHEIPPEDWRHLFGPNGSLPRLLRPNGHLLILEDMEIPHGEKAHRFGFLLLDTPHLHRLFSCKEGDPPIRTIAAKDGRLKVHAVPAQVLGRTDQGSTRAALNLLMETARDEISRLRSSTPDSRSGRLHALWTQLLANCDLGLQAL